MADAHDADECFQPGQACGGSRTVERRNALGHPVERGQYDEGGAVVARARFTPDELGRVRETEQGNQSGWQSATRVTTTYDSLGRVIARRDPDAAPAVDWTYGYDRNGNLRYQNDPKTNQHLEWCYDALGRVTKKFALAGDAFANQSCAAAATVTYTYNNSAVLGLGQVTQLGDEAGGWQALQFDVLGRVLRERRTITVAGDTTTAETTYQYDASGDHLWKLTYPDGEVVTYTYDGAGRVQSPAVVGVRVRRRHAALTSLALVAGSLPWPIVLLPAPAGAQCPTPIAVHYHFDRLGSTHLLTAPDGSVRQHTRYSAYGTPRRYAANGAPAAFDPRYRREFTGYETEPYSGLQYAGARFYDPALGMFQTHDPADEFASPYTYTNWDPINFNDPTGAWAEYLGAAIGALSLVGVFGIAMALAGAGAAISAAIQGASVSGILTAAAIGGAIGNASFAVTTFVVQPILQAAVGTILTTIVDAGAAKAAEAVSTGILIAGGVGQSAYSLSQGEYFGGSVGLAMAAVGLLGLATQGANGASGDGTQFAADTSSLSDASNDVRGPYVLDPVIVEATRLQGLQEPWFNPIDLLAGFAAGAVIGGMIRAAGGAGGRIIAATGAAEVGEYTLTRTVAGKLAERSYLNSPLTLREIMAAGRPIPDPGGVAGALRDVPGAFRGSAGTWELVVNPQSKTVLHWMFKSAP